MTFHKPILLKETIEGLKISPEGVYVDMTFGGGGHSSGILNNLNAKGRLISFDQDEDAFANALVDDRFQLIRSNFRHAHKFLRLLGIDKVDGIMADLGVSSHQFDEAERGFSYRFDSELDMRMNRKQRLTAKELLKQYSEQKLLEIFSAYGEIRNSKQLARRIVTKRSELNIHSVKDFENVIDPVIRGDRIRYLAQTFQAIRMEVNGEMDALKDMLESTVDLLKPGGRLVILTFHSIEDRMVKKFIKTGNVEGKLIKDAYGVPQKKFREAVKGVVLAEEEERRINSRSKSAKLRIAERL